MIWFGTWMDAHQVPALSLAFARPGELLMARAWGVVEWGGRGGRAR